MEKPVLDVLIVGGGINGAGIAADAAGRGLEVGLFEAADFASATSSASSKLIHGGLRYLEHYEFRLVSESLAEREVLLKKAPHIAKPMRFRLPHRPHLRPAWMIRAGLFLYDHLGKRVSLPASQSIKFGEHSTLKPQMTKGFEYSDCWVDDARLVLLNLVDASERGAEIRNRCTVENAERENGVWKVTIFDQLADKRFTRYAKSLVNAAGPWVQQFIEKNMAARSPRNIRLVKGSHIVVPKVHDEPQAYILQNEDSRIVFVLPYLDRFSVIGTTDVEFTGDPRDVAIDQDEIDYLLEVYNSHFKHTLGREDVVWNFSGVRPLCDDESDSPQAITRDYTLELQDEGGAAPLLSVFGGKLTTYRKLAQAATEKLSAYFPDMGADWTHNSLLPGAENFTGCGQLATELNRAYPWLDTFTCQRFASTYGSRAGVLLAGVKSAADMGQEFGAGLTAREVQYQINCEFVTCGDDLLWRRTKLGLYLSREQQIFVGEFIKNAVTGSDCLVDESPDTIAR